MSTDQKNSTHHKDLRLSDLAIIMQDLLRGYVDEIHKLIESTISQLKENFSALLTHYDARLKIVQERMEQIEVSSRVALDASQSIASRNKLVVHGIPNVDGENLCTHFTTICTHLGYPIDQALPVVHLTRFKNPKNACRSNQPILIEFAIHGQREMFFAKYLQTRTLSQQHLGFTTERRIFINEYLSIAMRVVFSTAMEMKRNGLLTKVYTKEGVIHAVTKDSRDIIIRNADDLLEENIYK